MNQMNQMPPAASKSLSTRWDGMRMRLNTWLRGQDLESIGVSPWPALVRRGAGTPPSPPSPHPSPARLGRAGVRELVEPRLRELVADVLGVGPMELTSSISLIDDLAADSLDFLEVAIAAEDAFGITVPARALAPVRTYGDLVELVCALVAIRPAPPLPTHVRARIQAACGTAILERAGTITPYLLQTIAEDACHAGRGARVDIVCPDDTAAERVDSLGRLFAPLQDRGIDVYIGGRGPETTPATATH